MPVTIKTGPLRFKDPSSGQYVGIDVIAERKTSEQIAEIENVGADALEEIGSAKEEALEEIREIVEDVGAMTIHICTAQEYDAQTGIPTIANPDATTFYLVPGGDAPNLYVEWVYVNNAWEQFGSASIDLSGYVQDVQVNGTSVVTNGVANVPMANGETPGVIKYASGYGLTLGTDKILKINAAGAANVKSGSSSYAPIVTARQHDAAFYGLAKAAGDTTQSASSNAVGTYTDAAKSAISTMLNGPVTVSGTTPSITALPGIQYVCGEVATLDITLPASGCVDVVFESGSTPTVLIITPPSGVTVQWPDWFDATAFEANRTYEINFYDGRGAVMSWT